MPESATQAGPTLEQLLFRAMDRAAEDPALLDVEEFAAHIAGPLTQSTSSEEWVDRFFAGNVELREIVAPDLAQPAPLPYSPAALHVYEFDLDRLEYVVLEEDDQFLVVSDSGQFSLPAGAGTRRAIESAAVPAEATANEPPRAWLVRKDGGLEPLHPGKLARALSTADLKQVSLQAVARPAARLQRWSPRRSELRRDRAMRARRENDERSLLGLAAPAAAGGGAAVAAGEDQPASPEPTVFMLLPDGTLAQPRIGSATRWSEMVSGWVVRGGLLAAGGDQKRVSGSQRYTISSGKITALFSSSGAGLSPGEVGNGADAGAEALSLVRADFAPVRLLGDEELASAVVSGNAQIVAGWKGSLANVSAGGAGYWIQPEAFFAPSDAERQLVARVDSAAGLDAPSTGEVAARPEPSAGQVPETQPALQPAGDAAAPTPDAPPPASAAPAVSAPEPTPVPTVAPSPPVTPAVPLPEAAPEQVLVQPPAPTVAPPEPGAIPETPAAPAPLPVRTVVPAVPPLAPALPVRPSLAPLSGALPPTSFDALRLSVERTAAAGAYRIPKRPAISSDLPIRPPRVAKAAPRPAPLEPKFPRPWRRLLPKRPVTPFGRVLGSLPFPNAGEVHVGRDLSHALHVVLTAPVAPLPPVAEALRPVRFDLDRRRHALALVSARRAALRLGIPEVGEILSSQQAASLRLLPPLLRQALRAGGEWVPGPGAPMPGEVRAFAAHGSFAVPEVLVAREIPATTPAAEPVERPLGVGEDELVIPTPLWSEMGRGAVPAAHDLMSSPLARSPYRPALGSYRLLAPPGAIALADETKHEVPLGPLEIAGPAGIHLEQVRGQLQAHAEAGQFVLRGGPVEQPPLQRRGRIRVGAPVLHQTASQTPRIEGPRATRQAGPASRSIPELPWPIEGTIVSPAPGVRPMSKALQEALRISREAAAREIHPAAPAQQAFPRGTVDRVDPLPRSASAAIQPPREPVLAAPAAERAEEIAPAGARPGAVALSSWQPYAGDWDAADRWAGGRSGSPRVAAWSYVGAELRPAPRTIEGVALQRSTPPARGSLPTGLRFRYVSAPLWWAASLRSLPAGAEPQLTDAQRSLGAALGASNLAGSLWRSILSKRGGHELEFAGGMDRRHDAPARELSGVSRRLDVLVQLGLVGKAAAGDVAAVVPRGPETVYVAIDEQGRAGPVTPDRLQKLRSIAQSVDMRVVTALPPSPPPLESMSAMRGTADAEVARARHPQARSQEDEAGEAVSQSKIEGSVEAVAQRIYHRVRRRLASDRERFGG